MLPVGHWWTLRKKFKQSIPGVVTDNYLATVLEMNVNSVRANVLPFLKSLGIIDDDGKTTEQAKLWRDDGHYPDVCKTIVNKVYPKELLEAVPNPNENRDAAKRWFANHTGAGESACNRMAALYTVLIEADSTSQPDGKKLSSKPKSQNNKNTKSTTKNNKKQSVTEKSSSYDSPPPVSASNRNEGPDININLQIHISADASSDQIEQIFAAMAKHIYKRG